jgi:BirA family biotin operon repressor/biotin-[acetyl-CoA-carboxylase] ligase
MRASDGSIVKLECHDALPSTSELTRKYAMRGYADRYVVLAEGKKKLDQEGRFRGEVEKGIYMSCLLRPSIFPSQASLLSSLSAVALTTALEEHTSAKLGIGWVSKIYCNGKIIGECTIEGKLDNFTSYEYIIVNFSVTLHKDDFPPRLTDLIRKVFETNNGSIPIIMAKNILNRFFPLYSNMKNNTEFMDEYRKLFLLRGHKVRYLKDGKKRTCKVLGVDETNCSLMVEDKSKKVVMISTPNTVIIPKKISIK